MRLKRRFAQSQTYVIAGQKQGLAALKPSKTAWMLAISRPFAQFPCHRAVHGLHSIDA